MRKFKELFVTVEDRLNGGFRKAILFETTVNQLKDFEDELKNFGDHTFEFLIDGTVKQQAIDVSGWNPALNAQVIRIDPVKDIIIRELKRNGWKKLDVRHALEKTDDVVLVRVVD